MKSVEALITLTTGQIRDAVWEWLHFHKLVKEVMVADIVFSEENVTARIRAQVGPK